MALVDYGSDSDASDSNDDVQPQQEKETLSTDNFFGSDLAAEDAASSSTLNLPSATSYGRVASNIAEGELDELVKPKDWELKLAKKAQKQLKKAKKREKKDKKKSKESKNEIKELDPVKKLTGKAKISAFGALGSIADASDSDDDIVPDKSGPIPVSHGKASGLLSLLPTPKTAGAKTAGLGSGAAKGNSILLPPSLRKTQTKEPLKPVVPLNKRKAESDDSDDDDDDGSTDFFGLSSAPEVKMARFDSVPLIASGGLNSAIGPAIPDPSESFVHPSQMYNYADAGPSTARAVRGDITDEQAYQLLSRDESIQAVDRRSLHDIAANIVDVRVDDALGPNVQANLLKNLSQKAMAKDAMAPLPKSKNVADQNAKRKHQITYLANLAVAREEALQEQWAESRINKKMGKEKYGF